MPKQIAEAQILIVADTTTPGRLRLQLVDSGWGRVGSTSPRSSRKPALTWPG